MQDYFSTWLLENGVPEYYLSSMTMMLGTIFMLVVAGIVYYLAKFQLLVVVEKMVLHSKNKWDDLLFEHQVFSRTLAIIPLVTAWFLVPHLFVEENLYRHFLLVFFHIAITYQVARAISALLNVLRSGYRQVAKERYIPLNSALQVIKLLVYLVASILSIAFVLNKSPLYLLSGLGALTAVLLLVFQDTIKGLVASIQISANRMLAPGDWIEIPQYGADGDVLEIGLNTVKVENFDRTITTVPTYALISGSFKNWRGMYVSGGRRIKRAITLDLASVRFYKPDEIKKLQTVRLIQDYLQEKLQEINSYHQERGIAPEDIVNQRQLTTVGTYRAYIGRYLKQHDQVHPDMTCMVRQLPATASGLPLELYFFCKDKEWVNYEAIQADIFDHLYAMAPIFNVRIFQNPTGEDWRQRP
ncbi:MULTISPECIES: mechanosensitive ion channel family protein [Thalassotalea]|uniref:mechanosensitive ion channel family protein n=1 Tax=Thalassotalea TaxID=1518149 RepID=UPI0009459DB5|nr:MULTISPECIES: mechanosensitive ion channel domain-containing protein [Thalassotalea]OKY27060.1 mechanosensitive ion channel protein MscS [Thalassotalea sp. PP2-459]